MALLAVSTLLYTTVQYTAAPGPRYYIMFLRSWTVPYSWDSFFFFFFFFLYWGGCLILPFFFCNGLFLPENSKLQTPHFKLHTPHSALHLLPDECLSLTFLGSCAELDLRVKYSLS